MCAQQQIIYDAVALAFTSSIHNLLFLLFLFLVFFFPNVNMKYSHYVSLARRYRTSDDLYFFMYFLLRILMPFRLE